MYNFCRFILFQIWCIHFCSMKSLHRKYHKKTAAIMPLLKSSDLTKVWLKCITLVYPTCTNKLKDQPKQWKEWESWDNNTGNFILLKPFYNQHYHYFQRDKRTDIIDPLNYVTTKQANSKNPILNLIQCLLVLDGRWYI